MLGPGHEPEGQVTVEPEVKWVAMLSESIIQPSCEFTHRPFWFVVAGALMGAVEAITTSILPEGYMWTCHLYFWLRVAEVKVPRQNSTARMLSLLASTVFSAYT